MCNPTKVIQIVENCKKTVDFCIFLIIIVFARAREKPTQKGIKEMKLSECNARQRKAWINIKNAANWELGGLENTLCDYAEDEQEYKEAKALLDNHEELVNYLYECATTNIYTEGSCCFNKTATQKELRDINFCGKEWLMARCEARIRKEGY